MKIDKDNLYQAALKFCQNRGYKHDELPKGYPSANFCPIALAITQAKNPDFLDGSQLDSSFVYRNRDANDLADVTREAATWPVGTFPDHFDPQDPETHQDMDEGWDEERNCYFEYLPKAVGAFISAFDQGDFPELHDHTLEPQE